MDDSIIIIEVLVASVIIKAIDINVSCKRASSTLLHNFNLNVVFNGHNLSCMTLIIMLS